MKVQHFPCASVAVALAMAVSIAGCFPARRDIFNRLHRNRAEAYRRWRREHPEVDQGLPRLVGELGLSDAVRAALAYSPGIQRAVQERLKADGQLWAAYGEALPRVDLSAGWTRLDQVFVVDLGVDSFSVGDRDNYFYQVDVVQPLFKGGTIPAAIRGAKFFEAFSDETVRQTLQDTAQQVAIAYYDVLLARRLHQVQLESLRFAQANLEDVTAREEAGVAIPFDRLRARVEVSNVQAEVIRQRNRLNRARTALFRAMGVSQKSDVNLTDRLLYRPQGRSFEQAVRTAFLNRPELYRAELDIKLQNEALTGLYSEYFPELEAWGWERWAKPDPHEASNIEWDKRWQLGVRLAWNIFDGLKREGNIKQQKAVLNQSAIALADAEQQVLQEVKNALLDLADAAELVESQKLNLKRANEALRLVTIGAEEGVNTPLEVLDARAALTRARGLYYEALHAHVTGRVRLQRAMGMMGPPPGYRGPPEDAPAAPIIRALADSGSPPGSDGGNELPDPETDTVDTDAQQPPAGGRGGPDAETNS